MPAWITASVLRIAIPDTPFGRGAAGEVWPAAPKLSGPAEPVLETVGFAEPEAATIEPIVAPEAAEPTAAPAEAASAHSDLAEKPPEIAELPVAEPPAEAAVAPAEAEKAATEAPAAPSLVEPVSPSEPVSPGPEISESKAAPLAVEPPPAAPETASAAEIAEVAVSIAPEPDVAAVAGELPPALIEPEPPAAGSEEPAETALARPSGELSTMRNRRLYRRVGIEAELEVDGQKAKLLDLSMGGFAATGTPPVPDRAVVPATIRLTIDGVEISTRMRARMLYTQAPRSGGRFLDLTASQTAFLRYVVTWRGQAVGAIGTTALLDAVTRWPEQRHHPAETLPAEPQARKTPWWSRWFGRLLGGRGAAS